MAASFYSSPLIGATTTLACFAHEIPHEIADYSILVRSGFTKRQAMQSQFLTAVGAFVSSVDFGFRIFALLIPHVPLSSCLCYLRPFSSDVARHHPDGNSTYCGVKDWVGLRRVLARESNTHQEHPAGFMIR
jgi:hypothetical protein